MADRKKKRTGEMIAELFKTLDDAVELGYTQIESGNFREALKTFIKGAQTHREDPDLLNGLGVSLCELGMHTRAMAVLDYALELHPEDSVIHANMAAVQWENGNYDMAIHHYHRSIKYDPEISESHINLINLHLERGDLFTALMEDAVSNEIVESGLWRTSLDSTLVKVADADDTFEKDGVTYNFFPDASFGNSSNEFRVNSLDNGNLLYRAFSYSALHAIYEIRQLR